MKEDLSSAIDEYLSKGGSITTVPANDKPFKLSKKKAKKKPKVCWVKRIYFAGHKLLVKIK
jgi:hypothetical protein